jgi:hypothetical protein
LEIAAQYSYVSPTGTYGDEVSARADGLIAVAGEDEKADIEKQYGKAGLVKLDQEIGGAVNAYFFNRGVKIANEVSYLMTDQTDEVTAKKLRYICQVQLAF